MLSFPVPCRVSLHCFWRPGAWCCHMMELGPYNETAIARFRIQPMDVARAKVTLVGLGIFFEG